MFVTSALSIPSKYHNLLHDRCLEINICCHKISVQPISFTTTEEVVRSSFLSHCIAHIHFIIIYLKVLLGVRTVVLFSRGVDIKVQLHDFMKSLSKKRQENFGK